MSVRPKNGDKEIRDEQTDDRFLALVAAMALGGAAASRPSRRHSSSATSTRTTPGATRTAAYAYVFKQSLEQYSGGQIKVELYPNGQLGDNACRCSRFGAGRSAPRSRRPACSPRSTIRNSASSICRSSTRAPARTCVSGARHRQLVVAKLVDGVAGKAGVRILSFEPYGFREMTTAKHGGA